MKKYLPVAVLLIASSSLANAWEWSIDFGSEYENKYFAQGDLLIESSGMGSYQYSGAVQGGVESRSNKRPSFSGNFGDWSDDFVFTVNLTLNDENIYAKGAIAVFAELSGNVTDTETGSVSSQKLYFGSDSENNDRVFLYGDVTESESSGLVSVSPGQACIISFTKIGNEILLRVNGVTAASGLISGDHSGTITDFALGGDINTQYRLNGVIHSVSMYSIPEPSLFGLFTGLGALALVGTRRRRR